MGNVRFDIDEDNQLGGARPITWQYDVQPGTGRAIVTNGNPRGKWWRGVLMREGTPTLDLPAQQPMPSPDFHPAVANRQ